jgi:hypothetical protein
LIRRLVADGVPQRQVARDLGVGRSTVARAVGSDGPSKYERPSVPTVFAAFEPLVRQLLTTTPDMPVTVIAERVGWTGSITWFRDNVRRVRVEHRPVDPSDRLIWLPGDAAQCDLWFPPKKIPLEDGSKALLPVMVITAAHSRFMVGQMIPTRQTHGLLAGPIGRHRDRVARRGRVRLHRDQPDLAQPMRGGDRPLRAATPSRHVRAQLVPARRGSTDPAQEVSQRVVVASHFHHVCAGQRDGTPRIRRSAHRVRSTSARSCSGRPDARPGAAGLDACPAARSWRRPCCRAEHCRSGWHRAGRSRSQAEAEMVRSERIRRKGEHFSPPTNVTGSPLPLSTPSWTRSPRCLNCSRAAAMRRSLEAPLVKPAAPLRRSGRAPRGWKARKTFGLNLHDPAQAVQAVEELAARGDLPD